MSLIKVENLSLKINNNKILNDINFETNAGKILGIIGESGSGKSMTANSIVQLLPKGSEISGRIFLENQDLLRFNENQMCKIRGAQIGFIFQEPMTALNPLKNIGDQVAEGIALHYNYDHSKSLKLASETLDRVGLPQKQFSLSRFPFELSGGQRQRVVIAMAIATKPQLLIADEPSTALDVTTQSKLLKLLKRLVIEDKIGLLMITHDLAVIAEMADDIIIMKNGNIVECGATSILAKGLKNPYSKSLFDASNYRPKINQIQKSEKPLLVINNITKEYEIKQKGFFSKKKHFKAVKNVSFQIFEGENVGLVGESGCGKSTLTRAILGLDHVNDGTVVLDGDIIVYGQVKRNSRKKLQVVFQDPYGSFNPRHQVKKIITEPLYLLDLKMNKSDIQDLVAEILLSVGLKPEDSDKFIHEFSGGQRQRIAIARSLIIKPKLIILDEAVSALDVSVRAQILDLLSKLSKEYNLSYLFISHDLSLVKSITNRVFVMKDGEIVESGETLEIFNQPKHEYTKSLISSTPNLNSAIQKLM